MSAAKVLLRMLFVGALLAYAHRPRPDGLFDIGCVTVS